MEESSDACVTESDIAGIRLARNLVQMLANHNFNVKRALTLERNRIVKDRAAAAMVLSKLMLDLGKVIENNIAQSSMDRKFKLIQREIQLQEAKFNKLEEYEHKLGIALAFIGENPENNARDKPNSRSESFEGSSSTSSSNQSQTSPLATTRFKTWRKAGTSNQFLCVSDGQHQLSFEVLTPKIIEARREIKRLTEQLDQETRRSEKTKSKLVHRRIQNLNLEITRLSGIIRGEEEFAKRFLKT